MSAPARPGAPRPPLSPLAAALASQEELELRALILVEHVVANARVAGDERGLGAIVQVVRTGGALHVPSAFAPSAAQDFYRELKHELEQELEHISSALAGNGALLPAILQIGL